MKNIKELLSQLEIGEHPSFFEVMAAINDISNLWPDRRRPVQDLSGDENRDRSIAKDPCFESKGFCEFC